MQVFTCILILSFALTSCLQQQPQSLTSNQQSVTSSIHENQILSSPGDPTDSIGKSAPDFREEVLRGCFHREVPGSNCANCSQGRFCADGTYTEYA